MGDMWYPYMWWVDNHKYGPWSYTTISIFFLHFFALRGNNIANAIFLWNQVPQRKQDPEPHNLWLLVGASFQIDGA